MIRKQHTKSIENPLVFIHGFKESLLSRTPGRRLWLTSWQALGLTCPDLRLPIISAAGRRRGHISLANRGWTEYLRLLPEVGRKFGTAVLLVRL